MSDEFRELVEGLLTLVILLLAMGVGIALVMAPILLVFRWALG